MELTAIEHEMLAGGQGPAVQKAMEIVVALGTIYGAERLVPVHSVQVAGVSYKNLGPAGLAFLREWAEQGAQVRVPTTLNPAGMDLQRWEELGFSAEFARSQLDVVEAFAAMGVDTTCTCTPYHIGLVPPMGAHLAWAESSAVSFANSVLGARTNREGGPSALAAAISGRTAAYGLHLEAERRPTVEIRVGCPLEETADWGALGILVGKQIGKQVPLYRLEAGPSIELPADEPVPQSLWDPLKALGAAMAAGGAVALYHVEGITPEARTGIRLQAGHETLVIDDLGPGYRALSGDLSPLDIDLVWLGCPHASLEEVARVAALAEEAQFATLVWVTASRQVRQQALKAGYVAAIEAAGGQVVADTCVVVAPLRERFRTLATLSAKGGYYTPSYLGIKVRYCNWTALEQVIRQGRWEPAFLDLD